MVFIFHYNFLACLTRIRSLILVCMGLVLHILYHTKSISISNYSVSILSLPPSLPKTSTWYLSNTILHDLSFTTMLLSSLKPRSLLQRYHYLYDSFILVGHAQFQRTEIKFSLLPQLLS